MIFKKTLILILVLFVSSTNSFSQDFAKNRIVVKVKNETAIRWFDKNTEAGSLSHLNASFDMKSVKPLRSPLHDTYVITFYDSVDVRKAVEAYLNTGLFEYVEPDYIGHAAGQQSTIPNDRFFHRQWGLYNDGSFYKLPSKKDADIDMELAWDITTGDSNIIVASLDAGVKLDHPEFDGRIWQNKVEQLDGQDNDSNSYVDDYQGWDFANNDNDPTDDHGHGTNVTGIIGANGDNDIGYAGVDHHCKLLICKIINKDNFGYYTWWAEAIYYSVAKGAKVINMSVGGSGDSKVLKDAIDFAYINNVTIVASMMNFDNDITYYPCGYENTIAVGSTNPNDKRTSPFTWSRSSGSNFGDHIDVVAPGNYIYGLKYDSDTAYGSYWSGTSQATPLVTGVCALLLAKDSNLSPDELRYIIQSTAEDQVGDTTEDTEGFDRYYGYGRLNAYHALSQFVTASAKAASINEDLTIYPNPSSSEFHITSSSSISQVTMRNTAGQIVTIITPEKLLKSLNINTKDIPCGTYWIEIQTARTPTHYKQVFVLH